MYMYIKLELVTLCIYMFCMEISLYLTLNCIISYSICMVELDTLRICYLPLTGKLRIFFNKRLKSQPLIFTYVRLSNK